MVRKGHVGVLHIQEDKGLERKVEALKERFDGRIFTRQEAKETLGLTEYGVRKLLRYARMKGYLLPLLGATFWRFVNGSRDRGK